MAHEKSYSDVSIAGGKPFKLYHLKDSYEKNIVLHHHDYLELYFFVNSNVSYLIEGKQYDIKPYDILIIDSGTLHQPIFKDGQNAYERYVLKISPQTVQKLSKANLDLLQAFKQTSEQNKIYLVSPNETELALLQNVFERLMSLGENTGYGAGELVLLAVKELLIYVNRIYLRTVKEIGTDAEIFESSRLMDDIIVYITENLNREITMQELSEKFFISKFYLSREFKKYVGTTIHRYIVQKRLILAKKLILQGMQIKEVYKQCGFADYCNFFRAFKNEYGFTPKQFYDSYKIK